MRIVILTSSLYGSATLKIPHLVVEPEIEIAMIIYSRAWTLNSLKFIRRKIKKVMKIGPLGFLNYLRIAHWQGEGVSHYLNTERLDLQAKRFGIRFEKTPTVNCQRTVELITEADAELGILLGTGYVAQRVFSIPKYGTINIHGEVLPQFQGAPSILWQIYEGSLETGYTIHQVDSHIDTGNILYQEKMPIELKPTLGETVKHNINRLNEAATKKLVDVIKSYPELAAKAKPQGRGRSFTSPTFRQYLRMVRQHRRLYREYLSSNMNEDLLVTTSWDDGQKIDLKLAELLTKYGIKGTFYITVYKSYHTPLPLEKQDVVEISREHEIGAHTLNHVDLTNTPVSEAKSEIEGSKSYIEELMGHQVKMFSYPFSRYNKEIMEIVKNAGFIGARTTHPGNFDMPNNPYEWQITLHASNGAPRATLRIWRVNHISIKSLIDWETRAKFLFDLALRKKGIYHLWGHGTDIDKRDEWDKLERVLRYISNKERVKYMTNGEIIEVCYENKVF